MHSRIYRNIVVLSCILLLICLSGASSRPLRLTYNPMPFNVPSMVEKDQAILETLGVTPHYQTFLVGYAMSEALASKQLDVATVMGATSVILSRAGGRDIRVISAYSQAPQAFALVGRSGEETPASLAGKRIAVPVGTEAHYLLARILEEQGLSLNDVDILNMLIPDGVSALQSQQVDAAMVVEPVLTRLVDAGQIQIIRDGQGLVTGLTLTVVREDLDPDLVAILGEALDGSLQFMAQNPEQSKAIAMRETGLPLGVIEHIWPKYDFSPDLTAEVLQSLEDTIDFLYTEGLLRERVAVSDLLW